MAAQRRQALVEAVSSQDTEKFLQLISDHKSKSKPFNLDEVLVEIPHAQLDAIWESLLDWTTTSLDTLLPDDDGEIESHKTDLISGIVETAMSTAANLQSAGDDEIQIPLGLLQVAAILNAMLLRLDELPVLDALCARICRLSELWWSRQLADCLALAPAALAYLLQLTVAADHKTTRSLVQRVLALLPCVERGALSAPCGGRLRQLLCAVGQCPALLAWEEGVRLLAELLATAPLRQQLHAAVKAALPGVSTQQAQRYGQVYYRAWRAADPAGRQVLEEECIQDLMYHAVHADRCRSRLPRLLFQLLHHLHGQRRHRDTAAMLVRLYQPILWRALAAPNETVQLNATFLLLDVFPLEEPGAGQQASDVELVRQCRLVIGLLQESSHQVRTAAAKGVCKALAQYWDIIPADSLKQMLKVLLQDLAYDASSVEVRQQVVSGMAVVLENPYTHVYMKAALPLLADAFHDVHLSVRVAMCDFLLKVKPIKNIRYFDVVPVKHLLARLAVDEAPVCRRIVQLMVNSFFPAEESDETLLSRCICLIEENRAASRRFYQHSGKVVSLEDAVRLMVAIRQALTIHAKRLQERRAAAGPVRRRSAEKENEPARSAGPRRSGKRRLHNVDDRSVLSDASQESGSSDDSGLEARPAAAAASAVTAGSPLDKDEVVLGLVDVVAVLWTSRLAELAQQVALLERLQQAWTRVLPLLFSQHKDAAAGPSLLYVSSLLPHAPMAPLASHCLSALRRLPAAAAPDRCAQLLDPLINWGRCDDVLELCTECLQAAFDGQRSFVASQKNQRRSAAGVRFREPRRAQPRPRLALRWLLHLFSPSLRRHALVTKCAAPLAELHAWMAACVTGVVEERLGSERADPESDELAAELIRAHVVLALALATGERPGSALSALQDLLQWGHGVASTPSDWSNAPLLGRVCSLLTEAALSTTLTGALCPALAAASVRWLLLHISRPDSGADRCVSSLFHAADLLEAVTCQPQAELSPWRTVYSELIPQLVGAAVGRLTNLSADGEDPAPAQLTELSSLLRVLLAGWRRLEADGEQPQRDLAALLLAAAAAHVSRLKLRGSTAVPGRELAPLTAALLAPLCRDEAGASLLLARLPAVLADAEQDGAEAVLAQVVTCAYVLCALTTANEAALRHCRPAVSAALAAAERITPEEVAGDDAPLQHLGAARQLLQELAARCPAA